MEVPRTFLRPPGRPITPQTRFPRVGSSSFGQDQCWALALQLTSEPRFNARTVSLCSQSLWDAVKWTQRTGTFLSFARLTHTARVPGSALVLSTSINLLFPCSSWRAGFRSDLPTTKLVPCSRRTVAALMHFSRCFKVLLRRRTTRASLQRNIQARTVFNISWLTRAYPSGCRCFQ